MLPGVPTRVDPLRQQVLGRDAEDLGDVCPDPLLSGSLRGTVGGVCVAVDRVRIDAQVFHLPVRIGDRSIIAGRNGPVWLPRPDRPRPRANNPAVADGQPGRVQTWPENQEAPFSAVFPPPQPPVEMRAGARCRGLGRRR